MDVIERIFFAEIGIAIMVALLAVRESIYMYRLGRSPHNSPPSWILQAVAVSTWTITIAAIYFGLLASIRLIAYEPAESPLRPLSLVSAALIIAVLAVPAYIGYEFRRRRAAGEE